MNYTAQLVFYEYFRYINISKHWIIDENRRFTAAEQEDAGQKSTNNNNDKEYKPTIDLTTGIVLV